MRPDGARHRAAARRHRRARPRDSTSVDVEVPDVVGAAKAGANGDLKGVKVGVVKQLRSGEGYQPGILASFDAAVECSGTGCRVSEATARTSITSLPAYYLILPSEVSSNLARFDAMRYGLRVGDDGTHSAEEVMALTRGRRFRPEVKRRIIIGTYALSTGYRRRLPEPGAEGPHADRRRPQQCHEKVDVPHFAIHPRRRFRLGEKVDDPLAMYLFDLCTLPLNLAGALRDVGPSGLSPDDNLPVGLQIMAPALADDRLYRVGAAYEGLRGRAAVCALNRCRDNPATGRWCPCESECSPAVAIVPDSTRSSAPSSVPATPVTGPR